MKTEFDLSKCMIDISKVKPGQKMIEAFPELSVYVEFNSVQDDNWIKLAILLADLDSPFLKIKENDLRVRAIFDFLEIGMKTPKALEYFDRVLNYKHEAVFDCCSKYLQMQDNDSFASWWSSKILYYELIKEKNKPKESGDSIDVYINRKFKIDDNLEKIAERIRVKEVLLFKDTKMRRAVANAELKKIKTYPEKFAEEDGIS